MTWANDFSRVSCSVTTDDHDLESDKSGLLELGFFGLRGH
jgi:hypothetical protein